MKIHSFRVIVEPDENNTFHGFVPVLPGCHTWGETIENTKNNLRDAIKAYINSLIDDNEAVPTDSGLEFLEIFTEDELSQSTHA